MNSSETSSTALGAASTAGNSTPSATGLRVHADAPTVLTVIHPAGITPATAEGQAPCRPLFARVTYRPA